MQDFATLCKPMNAIRHKMPWWARIALKLVLSRIPLRYSVWQLLHLFRHGAMDDPGYAISVFEAHWNASRPNMNSCPDVAIELGPGDSLASAVIAYAHGIDCIKLVDAGPFAQTNMDLYHRTAEALAARGLRHCELGDAVDVAQMLRHCGGEYLTEGVASLERLPPNFVGWIWSQAVLEHIRLEDVDRLIAAMRRIMRKGAIASRRIDLKDHLGGGLNSLRFGTIFWERNEFAFRSGFYTNRLRARDWLQKFETGGFEIISTEIRRWETVPLDRAKLASEFQDLPDSELKISGIDLLLRAT